MKGRVALVTGATGGIGKEIARGLARAGATLVIGARSDERGRAARDEIAKDTGNEDVTAMKLDVADQRSIRAFADAFRAKHDKLSVLVNNAGAWFSDRRTSPDGRELTFATNVIGPYLLTELLVEPLAAGAPSRVVNIVSSIAGDYDASDLDFERRKFDGFKCYSQSKQALRMLTWSQAKRLGARGIMANAAAPGFVKSDFNQNARGFTVFMINLSSKLFGVTPAKGAETPLWVATSPELASATAKYYDGMKEKDGRFRDEAAIADLETRLAELTRASATSAPVAAAS